MKHKSKSDNCLHKIDCAGASSRVNSSKPAVSFDYSNSAPSRQLSLQEQRLQELVLASGTTHPGTLHHKSSQQSSRFGRKVFDQLTSAIASRVHPTAWSSGHSDISTKDISPGCSRLKKTRSLEKDFHFRVNSGNSVSNNSNSSNLTVVPSRGRNRNSRVNQWWRGCSAEESHRRTRSLERNHRYLVTLDSTCRYVRDELHFLRLKRTLPEESFVDI